jgi:hypothetical protein
MMHRPSGRRSFSVSYWTRGALTCTLLVPLVFPNLAWAAEADSADGQSDIHNSMLRRLGQKTRQVVTAPSPSGAAPCRGTRGGVILLIVGVAGAAVGGYGVGYGASSSCTASHSASYCSSQKIQGYVDIPLGGLLALYGAAKIEDAERCRHSQPPSAATGVSSPAAVSAGPSEAQTQMDQIRNGSHGTIPPAEAVGRNAGGVTTTTVRNGTQYTLNFYLVGPVSRSLVISPGQAENLHLPPGSYEVGARVSSPDVSPFYGVQNYDPGTAYSENFYIQAQ